MLNSIQTYYLNKKLETKPPHQPLEKFDKKVGVLFNDDVSDRYQLQQLVVSNFDIEPSQIQLLGFSRHRYDKVEQPDFVFIQKDFSLFGEPKSEVISKFINFKYQYLFNFFGQDELCLELVALLTQANLKVGLAESNERINDLSFALETKNLDFFKESSKYIKHIR